MLLSGVLVITFLVLIPTLYNGWTNLDDPMYVLDNPLIRDLSFNGIKQMFSTLHVNGSYNPLVLLSWAIDYSLVGIFPALYHAVNLGLHLICVILVFHLAYVLSKNNSVAFGTALLFGIHPMHVEAIAWITSRKELLYTLFYLLGLITYYWYLEKKILRLSYHYLILSFIFYSCALFSKGSALTFPLVLWLFDYLKNRKDTIRLIIEKLPFLILSILFTYLSIIAQKEGNALQFRAFYSVFDSLSVGFYGYLTYLIKIIYPHTLSALHPYPTPSGSPSPWYFSLAAIPILTITAICIYKLKKARSLVFGFAFYFITLIPVIQVLSFAVSVTADRFTYLPYFGVFYIMSLGIFKLWNQKSQYKKLLVTLCSIYALFLSYTSFNYSATWKNSETVWSRIIEYYPNYFVSYINRSEYRIKNGFLDAALKDCNTAIQIKKDYFLAYYNRGYIYEIQRDNTKAINDYSTSILYNPKAFQAYQNRGILYVQQQKFDLALNDFNHSIKLKPKDALAYLNRASLYEKTGLYDKAIQDATSSIALFELNAKAYYVRAKSFLANNTIDKALNDFSKAITIDPKLAGAYTHRGTIYFEQNLITKAISDFNMAIQLEPQQVDAHINLGIILMNNTQLKQALFHFTKAQQYAPNNYLVYINRALLYKRMHNYQNALKDIEKSISLAPTNNAIHQEKLKLIALISNESLRND